jgi:hypothetical protein
MDYFWIAPDGTANQQNCYFRARKMFDLQSVRPSVTLKIAAESTYRIWINGTPVGHGPARGSRRCNFYDSYEIASYLQTGHNIIAVLVQCMNIPNFVSFPHQPALWVAMDDLLGSDQTWDVLLVNEWKQDVEWYTMQVGFMEHRDMRLEPVGWQTFDDDAVWRKAQNLCDAEAMGNKRLLPRPIPMLRQTTCVPPSITSAGYVDNDPMVDDAQIAMKIAHQHYSDAPLFHEHCQQQLTVGQDVTIAVPDHGRDVAIVFDFADEFIGYVALELSSNAGVIVDFAHDEELVNGWVNPVRHHYRTADRYITRHGRQTLGNTMQDRGFRYVMIVLRNLTEPVILHGMTVTDCRYPYENKGKFSCSDSRLTRIWDVCVNTLSACTTDTFMDCPWRERSFWVNDLVVENLVTLAAFGDPRINAHCLRLALSNAREDGWIPGVCPDNGADNLVLVPTNLFLLLMLDDYYRYTGDRQLVVELLPQLLGILKLFESHLNADGLLVAPKAFWNFFDWSFELDGVSLNGRCTSLLNWLYCDALNKAAQLMDVASLESYGSPYQVMAQTMSKRIDRFFWDESNHRYADWLEEDGSISHASSQLTHAFALLSGVLPEHRKARTIAALDHKDIRIPELYLHHFVFQAMQTHGMTEQVLARINQYWGAMIDTGTTTLWEAYIYEQGKAAFNNAGSLCHGFGATPIQYFQTVLLGVTPLLPGFETFSVQPVPHDLTWASGVIPTPHGIIGVQWEAQENNLLHLKLSVPSGTRGFCNEQWYGPGEHLIRCMTQQPIMMKA